MTGDTHFDLIVIGGGASGMMAAGRAAQRGKRVLLLEKNKALGEKLKITGGGRCNITNAERDVQLLLKNYGPAGKFLFSPFSQFGVAETFEFFESRGLPLVVEEHKRAFPKSHRALDVFRVLETYISSVTVKTGAAVKKIHREGDRITGVEVGGVRYTAGSYILATGGMSHPETGSTGDGFSWLAALGHTVATPTPSLVPLAVRESWVKKLSGISLPDVKITFFVDGVKSFAKAGKILCTHFGISGPLILNNSAAVSDLLHTGEVTAHIDLFPKQDAGALERTIIAIFDDNKNKSLKSVAKLFLPEGTVKGILPLTTIDPETKAHSITKEQRKSLVRLLKSLPLTIMGLMGLDKSVVVDGGVDLREIDMRSMRSKKYANLYVTGDLLHIRRPSGGYSLQLCWTTGWVAGSSV